MHVIMRDLEWSSMVDSPLASLSPMSARLTQCPRGQISVVIDYQRQRLSDHHRECVRLMVGGIKRLADLQLTTA